MVMYMTSKIYALIGPHASGKSTLISRLVEMGVHCIPVYTTRAPMEFDKNRTTTKFLSQSDFLKQDWIVKVTYKGDYYGLIRNGTAAGIPTARFITGSRCRSC